MLRISFTQKLSLAILAAIIVMATLVGCVSVTY